MSNFTADEKRKCAERELKMRLRVYPRWIASGRMTLEEAEYETNVMREIAADYDRLVENEQPRLAL